MCIVGIILFLASSDVQKDVPLLKEKNLREGDPTKEDLQLLSNAIKFLRGDIDEVDKDLFPSEEKVIGTQQMDKTFGDYSKDAKDRYKHMRSLYQFFGDYNKISKSYSKDLARLSQTAESYVKAENDKYLDKWWNALSIAMDHLSQDQDFLSDILEHDICYNLHRVSEEHSHLEQQLNTEGNKHLNKIKEATKIFESRAKDRDKIKEKMQLTINRTTATSTTVAVPVTTDTSRWTTKLANSESLLQDAIR
jgi:hypothetical protein